MEASSGPTQRSDANRRNRLNLTSYIEAVRRADGSARPQELSPADLQVALVRVGAAVQSPPFGFN